MEKIFAFFPNLLLDAPLSLHGVSFVGMTLPDAGIAGKKHPSDSYRALGVLEYTGGDEKKRAQRTLEVLRCHLMLIAHLTHQNPTESCTCLVWQEGRDRPKLPTAGLPLTLAFLAQRLPQKLEPTALTASWLARYLERPAKDEEYRLLCLYNALGALPGGYDGILAAFPLTEEHALMELLLRRVKAFQSAENDDMRHVQPPSVPFSQKAAAAVEACYLRRLLELFPELG